MIKFHLNFLLIFFLFSSYFWPTLDLIIILVIIILHYSPNFNKSRFLNWPQLYNLVKSSQIQKLLFGERKEFTGEFRIFFTLKSVFIFVLIINLSGLNIFLNQIFMGKLSISLIFMALGCWLLSYSPFLHQNKEKFRLFIIGEIKFPSLSFLLSNIEILTHLFRPITLTARLWVNIWVGHLLMRALSTFFLISMGKFFRWIFLIRILFLGGFFLFECGIMCLQAFVFRYLIRVYWKENLEHSHTSF